MKKIISSVLIFLLLFACVTPCLAVDNYTSQYCISETEGAEKWTAQFYVYGYIGDADCTDDVTIKDATTIQKHIAGLLTLKDTNYFLADADLSNEVNIKDATTIQKWLADIAVTSPVFHLISDKTDKSTDHVHRYRISTLTPTCHHGGSTRYNCTCGEAYESNETNPTDHKWSQGNCTTPSVCSLCGQSDWSLTQHLWDEPTCTTPRTCSVCGETQSVALGHNWDNADCTTPETCLRCGETRGTASGHSWEDATCSSPKYCNVCLTTQGNPISHNYKNGSCTMCGQSNGSGSGSNSGGGSVGDPDGDDSNGYIVYKTPTGKRYHLDPDCGGKNSTATTLAKALQAGLTPCKTCAQ